jgi:hypothetical protein
MSRTNIGNNLPQEAPEVLADNVIDDDGLAS